jgi:uncharacterized membrane protein
MEFFALLLFLLVLLVIIGSIMGITAHSRIAKLKKTVRALRKLVMLLDNQVLELRGEKPVAPPVEPHAEHREHGPVRERKPLPTPLFAAPRDDPPFPIVPPPPPPPPAKPVEQDLPPILPIEEEVAPPPMAPPVSPVVSPPPPAPPAPVPQKRSRPPEPVLPTAADRLTDADWWARVEDVVGKRWLTYAGGLVVFAAVGFFVKYAIDVGWIGPLMRVLAGVVFGTVILLAGDQFIRRDMRVFGLGLIGAAGLPILYVSIFAAFQLYSLFPQWVCFGAMILVTVSGMALALKHDSLVVSFLSLIGGFLTPVLVSTGQDLRDPLFAYLLILDLGVLGIAFYRQWRALDVLAFLGTAIYYGSWFLTFYVRYDHPPVFAAMFWLSAFYLTFLVLPFTFHLKQRTEATRERFGLALVVAGATFWMAFAILHPQYRSALALVSLLMAGCYAVLGVMVRARTPSDQKAVFSFLAFATTFLTVAPALHFRLDGITISWAAEAGLLLYIGFRYAYAPLRVGGAIVLGLAVLRLFARHWPLHEETFTLLLNRPFGIAAFVTLAAFTFTVLHRRFRTEGSEADRVLKFITGIGAGVLATIVMAEEAGSWFAMDPEYFGAASAYLYSNAATVVWTVSAMLFVTFGVRREVLAARITSLCVLGVSSILLLSTYSMGRPGDWFLNARFFVALGVAGAGLGMGLTLRRETSGRGAGERQIGEVLTMASALAIVGVLTVDLVGLLLETGRYAALCGATALWTTASAAFFLIGVKTRLLAWRVASLPLLGIGTILALAAHGAVAPEGFTHFLNARFAVTLLVAAIGFLHGELRRRSLRTEAPLNAPLGIALSLMAGLALLLLFSRETWRALIPDGQSGAFAAVTALWSVGALAYLFAGLKEKVLAWRVTGVFSLLVSGVLATTIYFTPPVGIHHFFLNLAFMSSVILFVSAFVFGTTLRRSEAEEQAHGEFVRWLGSTYLLVILAFELSRAVASSSGLCASRSAVLVLLAAASVGFVAIGIRLRAPCWYNGALVVLATTVGLGLRLFAPGLVTEFTLFLNARFLALALTVGAVFACGRLLLGLSKPKYQGEQRIGRFLSWTTLFLLFFVLSAETFLYAKSVAVTEQQARFGPQMALSITWSVYAISLLILGFRYRLRALRLVALGLFGVTVAKLVLLDLAVIEQEQIFRILSFLVAGLLMIGGSYIYHRVEKRLAEQ